MTLMELAWRVSRGRDPAGTDATLSAGFAVEALRLARLNGAGRWAAGIGLAVALGLAMVAVAVPASAVNAFAVSAMVAEENGDFAADGAAPAEGPVPTPPKMVCTAALRNPFWAIGYEGELEAITDGSDEAASTAASAKAEAAAAERAAIRRSRGGNDDDPRVQAERWREAQELIRVGGVTTAFVGGDERRVVNINSRTYFKGDFVVVESKTHRFIWQIVNFDDIGAVSLSRIKYISLTDGADGN